MVLLGKIIKKKDGFSGQKAVVIPRQVLQTRCAENTIIKNLYVTDIGITPKLNFITANGYRAQHNIY